MPENPPFKAGDRVRVIRLGILTSVAFSPIGSGYVKIGTELVLQHIVHDKRFACWLGLYRTKGGAINIQHEDGRWSSFSYTNAVFCQDIELVKSVVGVCICSIQTLMQAGCQCGNLRKE